MTPSRFACFAILLTACFVISTTVSAAAQDSSNLVPQVSRTIPVRTGAHVLSAQRPMAAADPLAAPRVGDSSSAPANTWTLLATIPGAVIHDIAFASPTVGYAAAEGGQVWKTTDGGKTWNLALNLGYPYYFYGVAALNGKNVAVTGFIDSATQQEGVLRWTHDGGKTWGSDIILSSTTWAQRVRFANSKDGMVLDLPGAAGQDAQYTTDGGATATDWTTDTANPDGGWFGLQFSLLPNLHARASGINFCTSLNAGAAWTCGPAVDSVFDGPVFFVGDTLGWVGGGEISPNVEGWVHVTKNGGKTWTGRTLDGPWPIREILFITSKMGWATGGNVYTNVGGIYFTSDGGKTWTVDADTGAEMDACDKRALTTGHQVWCAGYNFNGSSFNGVVYSTVTP